MVLSERLISKYQQTYKRKFNKNISPKEAERELFDLTELLKLIIKERKNRHAN